MMPRFSPGTLLALVAAAGLGYAAWYQASWKGQERARARACCSNQNLIDRYVSFWEAQNRWLTPGTETIVVDFDASGTVVRSEGPGAPPVRSRAIAEAALDDEAFRCPESGPFGRGVHYRWVMVAPSEPLVRPRRTICLLHGEKGPTDDPETRHAW